MKRLLSVSISFVLVFMLSVSSVYAAPKIELGLPRTGDAEAVVLKQLGLFKGVSENDFALHRAPTRLEALVMLIRLLGEEKDAMANIAKSPFNDVPNWGKKYVDYAYAKGYTKGVSATKFDPKAAMPAKGYLTFVLRALGYSDSKGDFTYNNPYDLADENNILEGLQYLIDGGEFNFLRGDVASISLNALSCKLNDKPTTLGQKLCDKKVITPYQLYSFCNMWGNDKVPAGMRVIRVNSVEQMFEAINDNTVVMLEDGRYDFTDYLHKVCGTDGLKNGIYNEKYALTRSGKVVGNEEFDGIEPEIYRVKNCHIIGSDPKKVELICSPRYTDVMYFLECSNCSISNVTMGHTPDAGECSGAVLNLEDCSNFTVKNCVLYGCGTFGVSARASNGVVVYEDDIKECSMSGIELDMVDDVKILNCYLHDNDCYYESSYPDSNLPIIFSQTCLNILQVGNEAENNTFGDF